MVNVDGGLSFGVGRKISTDFRFISSGVEEGIEDEPLGISWLSAWK
jgi:hypothetical protein